jgi:hypothetical protein
MLGNSKALSAGDPVLAIGKPGRNDLLLFSARIAQVRPVCAPKDIAAGRCKQELTVLEIALPDEPTWSGNPPTSASPPAAGVSAAAVVAGAPSATGR